MSKLIELAKIGQSVWFDYIRRNLLISGELQRLINNGVRGITSNPTIFEKAIAGSNDYDEDIKKIFEESISLKTDGYYNVNNVYEKLVLKDISLAADLMIAVYNNTNGLDGYVSIEVEPDLANDTEKTIHRGKEIFRLLNRPNIMIKVPATTEGIPAVKELIASGVNVNVTLIFSFDNYKDVLEAYISGLEELVKRGGDVSDVSSVASFFVSRVDTSCDKEFEKIGRSDLLGKVAIANSKISYKYYQEVSSSERWTNLKKLGAKEQRLLWASTGTKNPNYPDTLYVDELIGLNTVNTVPPQTLDAYIEHGKIEESLTKDFDIAIKIIEELNDLGIDLSEITNKLQIDGVKSFLDSYVSLLSAIKNKMFKIEYESEVTVNHVVDKQIVLDAIFNRYNDENLVNRFFDKDYTIWSDSPIELANRLDWVTIIKESKEKIYEVYEFVDEIIGAGFKKVLLLGMGGSSLSPEVFRNIFGAKEGYLDLKIVDSTHPEYVNELFQKYDTSTTIYIVSTKSGGTVETFSFLKYYYREVAKKIGADKAGEHFVAITDPGSGLAKAAVELGFRKTFLNNSDIGGRYSVLSQFGLVPAALVGVDLNLLLAEVEALIEYIKKEKTKVHPFVLGEVIGKYALMGKDKLTFFISDAFVSFGSWVEQLVAESAGKNGKGILPIIEYNVLEAELLSKDRVMVIIRDKDDVKLTEYKNVLCNEGFPVIEFVVSNVYQIGYHFYMWQVITGLACRELGVQPFDQPNVESAKVVARKLVQEYKDTGKLTDLSYGLVDGKYRIIGEVVGNSFEEVLTNFLSDVKINESYISIQAFIKPSFDNDKYMHEFKDKLMKQYKVPVTFGYGPRFLHSTGQLHKGDGGSGFFIQFIDGKVGCIEIPEEATSDQSYITFGVLIKSQAFGDRQALLDNNRKVLSVVISDNEDF